jgi:tetratricopeptide (TPR) repeat protein
MTVPGAPPSYLQLTEEIAAIRARLGRDEGRDALELVRSLEQRYPDSGQVRELIGDVYLSLGDHSAATSAYRWAVHLNDALPESWQRLERLYRAAGQPRAAEAAAVCGERVRSLPPELLRASFLLNEGQLNAAEQLARGYLRQHGPHTDGMRLLAQCCIKANVLDDAELLLENVLDLRPHDADVRFEYAAVLAQRRRYLAALEQLTPLLKGEPGDPRYRRLYAQACDGLGRSDEALRIYRQLAEESPQDPTLPVAMAHILRTTGAAQEAAGLFETALQSPATFAQACLALCHLRGFQFSDALLAKMRAAESAAGVSREDRTQLCFALGHVLDRRGAYREAFGYYERGNELKRATLRVNPETFVRTMQRQEQVCTAQFFAARRGFGSPRPDPIFIVGMPRAGSTLIEQILASHSQIDATLELPDIPRLVHQFRDRTEGEPPRYPAILAELTAAECRHMGEAYLEDTQVYRRGAPLFLDKMPNNFRDLGFIHLILPNARVIDARREPMACCFGNFKQLFPEGMEFKYSFEELGRYYCQYVALMEHWQRVLPGKILRVDYEAVVNDLEGSVRRLLDFLQLPFEPACLEFHRTERTVRTLSADQVRRPISREGLEQWRHYEPWLAALKQALEPLTADAAASVDA